MSSAGETGFRRSLILGGMLMMLAGSVGPAAGSEVYLGLSRSAGAKIPLGILAISAGPDVSASASTVRAIIEADLRRSQLFDLVPLGDSFTAATPPTGAVIREAAKAGVDVVVWGRFTKERDGWLVFDGYGFDGGSGEFVMRKAYRGADEASLRSMAHQTADAVVAAFTGEKGIAQTRIAFTSDRTGKKEIFWMDYDGANVRQVTTDRSIALTPRWSPDGKLLTFVSYREGSPSLYNYVVASARRSSVIKLPGSTIAPAWSPTGDQLAFSSSQTGDLEIYRVDREGKNLKRLTFSSGTDLSPSWLPTGRQIVYSSDRGGSPQIYIMDADGSDQRRLTFEGTFNSTPAVSPKGDWIAYTCRVESHDQICLIAPDGSRRVQLTGAAGDNDTPSWAPDGRHLVFVSNRDGSENLYLIGVDGTGEERLTMEPGKHQMPSWSPF